MNTAATPPTSASGRLSEAEQHGAERAQRHVEHADDQHEHRRATTRGCATTPPPGPRTGRRTRRTCPGGGRRSGPRAGGSPRRGRPGCGPRPRCRRRRPCASRSRGRSGWTPGPARRRRRCRSADASRPTASGAGTPRRRTGRRATPRRAGARRPCASCRGGSTPTWRPRNAVSTWRAASAARQPVARERRRGRRRSGRCSARISRFATRSRTPGTPFRSRSISLAIVRSTARSSPKTLIATAAGVPERMWESRCAIGPPIW